MSRQIKRDEGTCKISVARSAQMCLVSGPLLYKEASADLKGTALKLSEKETKAVSRSWRLGYAPAGTPRKTCKKHTS